MIKPILFNTPMTVSVDDGTKSETRRVVKYDFEHLYAAACAHGKWYETFGTSLETVPDSLIEWYVREMAKPPCAPGDVLWVRETWTVMRDIDTGHEDYFFAAIQKDLDTVSATYLCDDDGFDTGRPFPWKPSIHMPKWIARLFLRVTAVRVERLRDIECIAAEGVTMVSMNDKRDPRYYFAKLWDTTIKPTDLPRHGWDANPWVWVIEFERCEKTAGWPGRVGEGGE